MQSTSPTQQQTFDKGWPFLMLALGLFRLADWWLGGYQDTAPLLAGLGFLLLAAGTAARSALLRTAAVPAWRHTGMALAWLGLALVLAGILLRHFGPPAGFPAG
jgi:hypothetical protein